MKAQALPELLSFNGGFGDTAGFLGLQGLFTAHVAGNFVTLGAALVYVRHAWGDRQAASASGVRSRCGVDVHDRRSFKKVADALRLVLVAKVIFLFAFFVLGVAFGPFPDSDSPAALFTGFAGIAGTAIQNAVQRVHFAHIPPTTLMARNTTPGSMPLIWLAAHQCRTLRPFACASGEPFVA